VAPYASDRAARLRAESFRASRREIMMGLLLKVRS
jgi:hypothetical protein